MNHIKGAAYGLFMCLAAALASPDLLSANDSEARLAAGGLTLVKSDNIRMIKEELEISTQRIKVRYRFLNESGKDISTTVAFPLPDYRWDPEAVELNQTNDNFKTFFDFKNMVNGRKIAVKRMRKAMINGHDVTERLTRLGLSSRQIFETFGDSTTEGTKLTRQQQDGIAKLNFELTGKRSASPEWVVSETMYWEQTFPKGKEIEVLHEYRPRVGRAPNYLHAENYKSTANPIPKALGAGFNAHERNPKEACLDKAAVEAIKRNVSARLKKAPDSTVGIHLNDVEYILGTGRNWKGPIASFTLRIIKDEPDQFVSLCLPGRAKQLDAKTLEFSLTNYTPQDRLVVYFITVANN